MAGVPLRALGWLWRAWTALVAGDAAAPCGAGVALGDIYLGFRVAGVALNLRFAWQAWHLGHWAGSGGWLWWHIVRRAHLPRELAIRRIMAATGVDLSLYGPSSSDTLGENEEASDEEDNDENGESEEEEDDPCHLPLHKLFFMKSNTVGYKKRSYIRHALLFPISSSFNPGCDDEVYESDVAASSGHDTSPPPLKKEVPETKDTTHDATRRESTSLPRFSDAFMKNKNMAAGFESQAPEHGADAASIDGSPAVVTPSPKSWDGGGPLHLGH